MVRIAVFASGNGTNAENIIKYFNNSDIARVTLVLSNKIKAKVLDRARNLGIESFSFSKKDLIDTNKILEIVQLKADFIVLAGFLWKIPTSFIKAFPDKIINIHPALLPKYGGKGMYGMHVHNEVKNNNDDKTGITIHYVNENYDKGNIIFQKTVGLYSKDTPDDIANKVHKLEYEYFPPIIEKVLISDTKDDSKVI